MSSVDTAKPDISHTNASNEPLPPSRASGGLRIVGWSLFIILLIAGGLFGWFQSDSAPDLKWMAWTKPTAIFFVTIVCLLLGMSVWEAFSPGGGPRVGILRFETTRGDRLFLSLLGSAFIHLAWLGLVGPDLWKALGVSLVYAVLVFKLV